MRAPMNGVLDVGNSEADSARRRHAYPLRMALLGGVSMLPMAAVFFAAPAAYAQTCPPPIVGPVTGPVIPSGNCSVSSTGDISGGTTGVENNIAIGTLSNAGRISGASYGVNNATAGTIGTLTNSGTIIATANTSNAGGFPLAGLNNQGSITAVNNEQGGTIAGYYYGFDNQYDGTLGTLINSGLIYAANENASGMNANNTISVIDNTKTGTITGGEGGISVDGTIGTISNAGTIGGDFGMYVFGSIVTLTNGGIISANVDPGVLLESGGISFLTNTGTISSGSDTGVDASAMVGTLTNSGIIRGYSGILSDVSIVALLNETTGTLAGSISGTIGIFNTTYYNTPGTIGLLMNGLPGARITADAVFGTVTGVSNESIIETLANNGTIYGGTFGIANSYHTQYTDVGAFLAGGPTPNATPATIGTLGNTGSIIGGSTGVYNDSGYIGTLGNSGTIAGTTIAGVDNAGTLGTLANTIAGTIYGGEYGVFNGASPSATGSGSDGSVTLDAPDVLTNSGNVITSGTGTTVAPGGTISVLSNSGLISGLSYGVYNDAGYIGTLTNTGTGIISGGETGLYNGDDSTIVALLNSAGGTITGDFEGVVNYGTIGSLTNSGLIDASVSFEGIYNDGTIGILTNNDGGTIAGDYYGIANSGTIDILTNDAGGTIVSYEVGLYNVGAIGSLTNSGVIEALQYYDGIFNDHGSIGTLTDSAGGTITGGTIGVFNYEGGTIMQFTNGLAGGGTTADTIFGSITGVSNSGAFIGNLVNNGSIVGGSYGITNSIYAPRTAAVDQPLPSVLTTQQVQGSIVTLTNTGSISGGSTGVFNKGGFIGTLTNSGTIFGGDDGIFNNSSGTIGTVSNTAGAVIIGGVVGLTDFGTINTLSNAGTILGEAGIGALFDAGIFTNQPGGVISGGTEGVQLGGPGSTLTNAGTIISVDNGDAINFGAAGSNFLTLTTGSVIEGTIDGGNSENKITLDGTDNLTSPITDFASGSALNIDSNGDWTASGTWAIDSVINDGRFGPGETAVGGVGSALYLTGNFTQNADGTLLVAVAPEEDSFTTSDFVITGDASLSGAVSFTFAPGTYEAGSHSFLSATDVTGTFTSAHYTDTPSGLMGSVTYPDETDPMLVLTGTSMVSTGPTTTSTITTPITTTSPPAFVVRPADTGIFVDELQSSANLAQASNAALLGKAAEGAAASSAVCAAEAGVTPAQTTPDKTTGVEKLTNAVADAFCGAGGWIQASGTAMDVEGEGDTPGYNADTAGFLAGIDAPVDNAGTRLGLAIGYDETYLADSAGGKGQVDTIRAGIFGSQAAGPFMLAGDFLYGHTSTNSQRVTGVGTANSSADGNIYSGALQADTLVHLGTLSFVPQAGLRIAGVSADSFAESGVLPAFALTGNSGFYTSVQPFVNLDVSTVFLAPANVLITPDASFGYAYEAGDIGHSLIVTAHDGTHFSTDYLKLDPSIAELSAGISAGKDSWSFYARYSAAITGDWTSQTGEAGLRIRF